MELAIGLSGRPGPASQPPGRPLVLSAVLSWETRPPGFDLTFDYGGGGLTAICSFTSPNFGVAISIRFSAFLWWLCLWWEACTGWPWPHCLACLYDQDPFFRGSICHPLSPCSRTISDSLGRAFWAMVTGRAVINRWIQNGRKQSPELVGTVVFRKIGDKGGFVPWIDRGQFCSRFCFPRAQENREKKMSKTTMF